MTKSTQKKKKNKKRRVKLLSVKKLSLPQLEAKAGNLWDRNLFREAESNYVKILSIDPKHCDAHYRLGILKLKNDCFEQALGHFKKALEKVPFDM